MESEERCCGSLNPFRISVTEPGAAKLLRRILTSMALLAIVLFINTAALVVNHGYILLATLGAYGGFVGLFFSAKYGVEKRELGCLDVHLAGWCCCLSALLVGFLAVLAYTISMAPRGPTPCCTPCLDHCAVVARPGASRPVGALEGGCSRKQNFSLACAGNCRLHCDDVEGSEPNLGDKVSVVDFDQDRQSIFVGRMGYVVDDSLDDDEYTVRFPDTGGIMTFASHLLALGRPSVGDSVKVIRAPGAPPHLVGMVGYIVEDVGGEWTYKMRFPNGQQGTFREHDVVLAKGDFWCWTPPAEVASIPGRWQHATMGDVRSNFEVVKFHMDHGCGEYGIAKLQDGWMSSSGYGYSLSEEGRGGSVLWVKVQATSQVGLLLATSIISTLLLWLAVLIAAAGTFFARKFQSLVGSRGFEIGIGEKTDKHAPVEVAVGSAVLVRTKSGGTKVQALSVPKSSTKYNKRKLGPQPPAAPSPREPQGQPRVVPDRFDASPRPRNYRDRDVETNSTLPKVVPGQLSTSPRVSPRVKAQASPRAPQPDVAPPRQRLGVPVALSHG